MNMSHCAADLRRDSQAKLPPRNSRDASGVFQVLCSPKKALQDASNRPRPTERPPKKMARVLWSSSCYRAPGNPQNSAILFGHKLHEQRSRGQTPCLVDLFTGDQ